MMGCVGKCEGVDLAIGYNAAYFTKARHIVNVVLDMGMFGFHGIRGLMANMEKAAECESDLESMVEKANLVI